MPIKADTQFHYTRDALAQYSEDLQISRMGALIGVVLNGVNYALCVLQIHDSGANRPDDDEQRIQVARSRIDAQRENARADQIPLFIGFSEAGLAFTAWEPAYVFSQNPKVRGSVYARQSQLEEAARGGAVLHRFNARNLARKSTRVAFPAAHLGTYMENWDKFHQALSSQELLTAINQTADFGAYGQHSIELQMGEGREKIVTTRRAFPRNPEFSRKVLKAYGARCCICSQQLGLVEAAHIVPHSYEESSDEVANGLALCIQHHRLYDQGLLLIAPTGLIKIGKSRLEHLKKVGQAEGLESVQELAGRTISKPASPSDYPSGSLLRRGMAIRTGS